MFKRSISNQEVEMIAAETAGLEMTKAERKAEREARKLERERKKKQLFLEKLVAPFILITTVLLSLLLLSGR